MAGKEKRVTIITEFMEEGVRKAGNYEIICTIEMKGSADAHISGADPLKIIEDVFATQRGYISPITW
jgi:hypothetical protein